MRELDLDLDRSQLRVHTYAEGFFSKLAHDLEFTCPGMTGHATVTDAQAGSVILEIAVASMRLAGTVRNGQLDPQGMSALERSACLDRMRRDVFRSDGEGHIGVAATLSDGVARATLTAKSWRRAEVTFRPVVRMDGTGELHVTGTADLSLAQLGVGPIRGPMNAFRLKDRVEVAFELRFAEVHR